MNQNVIFILTMLCITIIPAVLFKLVWNFVKKRGWGTLRLYSLVTGMFIIGGTLILWFFIRDRLVLVLGLLMALVQIIATLNWKRTAPGMIERLKLRK
ncbi:MAG: hypothetical protein U0Z26_08755 [Anaerolineales bacterium]